MEDALVEVDNFEPSFEEVLTEPIARHLTSRDGVTEEIVRQLKQQVAAAPPQTTIQLTGPLPDRGRQGQSQARLGVRTPPAIPAWPRVFPSL
jgi:hypothetical protein